MTSSSDDLARALNNLSSRARDDIEKLVAETHSNVETYERLKWYLAAECSAAGSVQRLLDYRDQVIGTMITRLTRQLPSAPPPQQLHTEAQPTYEQPTYAPPPPPPSQHRPPEYYPEPPSEEPYRDPGYGYDERVIEDILRGMSSGRYG